MFNALVERGRRIATTCDLPPSRLRDLPTRIHFAFFVGPHHAYHPAELELRISILHQKSVRMQCRFGRQGGGFYRPQYQRQRARTRRRFAPRFRPRQFSQRSADDGGLPRGARRHYRTAKNDDRNRIDSGARFSVLSRPARRFALAAARPLGRPPAPNRNVSGARDDQFEFSRNRRGFGNRNHATVMYACNKIASLVAADESLAREISILREDLRHS